MTSASTTPRLRATLPRGVLPERFTILAAAEPDDLRSSDRLRVSLLGDVLRVKDWPHFPVEVVLPGEPAPRPGFGIIEDLRRVAKLSRDFHQPVLFWVDRGQVEAIDLAADRALPLGPWSALADGRAPDLHGRGHLQLLDQPATAFLCSTQCPGDKILEAYDWARRQCDDGGTVISGFHTPVEKDVLAILLRRGANIIWVPARDLPKGTPADFKASWTEGRTLILSPFAYGAPSRPTRESCSVRNRFVLSHTSNRYIPHVAPGSALAGDVNPNPSIQIP